MKQAQVIYYLHKGNTREQPHSIDVGYMECTGLLLKDFKRRLNAIRGRRMPDSFSWSYKRNYKDEFIWHDVSDNDVLLPTDGREYVVKGCEILRADEEPEFKNEPTKPTTHLPDDELVDDSRDIGVYKPAPEQRTSESVDTRSLLLFQRDEGLRQQLNKSSRNSSASSRADKPLPDSRHRVLLPSPQDTFELSSSRSLREEPWTPRTRTRSLMQMLRCGGDVKVERNNYHTKSALDEREGLSVFSSWMDSSKSWREKLVPLAFAPKTSTTTSSGNRMSGRPETATSTARSRSLTRYRPRNSFSNSEYFEHGSYDIYPRAEKVKEVDMNRQSNARSSTESLQLESDPYYFYKTRASYDRRSVEEENEESSGMTVSSRFISKLVQANETDKDRGVEGVPTPNNYESRPRKSSLDWEKNLQEAVNMIIRPPSSQVKVVL